MADNDKPEPDDIDKDAANPQNADDGDLGFANDTWAGVPSSQSPPITGLDRDFIPQDLSRGNPESEAPDSSAPGSETNGTDGTNGADESDETSASDTWVPDVSGAAPDASGSDSADERAPSLDADKTWVPTSTPTAHGLGGSGDKLTADNQSAHDHGAQNDADDVNKTLMPSSTPTVDGTERNDGEDDDDPFAVDKTWVAPVGQSPSDPDVPPSAADDEPLATDKTWVASGAPTVNAADLADAAMRTQPAGNSAVDRPNDRPDDGEDDTAKTWVPSSTPTRHVMGPPDVGGEPPSSSTPTVDALGDPPDPSEMGTVVAGPPPDAKLNAGDSAIMETVEAPLLGSDQTVYSQTMGMRSPGNDQFDDWQAELDALNEGDTAVIDVPDDTGTLTSRKTQIWSQQSGDGLSSALTIRHAPVAGESLFDNTLNSDKPDYQIIRKLAEGGMGAVYVARQTSLGRELAIKTLKPLRDRDRKTYTAQGRISQVEHQRREMFLSEALVTGNLVHPHIIPIHDLCQTDDGSPFYSMKRVHGTPWNERIQEMTLDENLEVLLKVCDAMAYAHHNGVVNRDLKPENVMLGEFGEVLVLDWGLAVPASAKDKGRFPSPAAPFGAGTPAYMSPELWTGPENHIGVWSDVYLLGATLFEAITGVPPHEFPEPDSSAGNTGLWMTIDKVVRRNAIRSTEHSGELMDIAKKAMATSPKERYRTVLKFQAAIKDWQQHEESRRLARRADASLESTNHLDRNQEYQNFQTAAALYEEAHVAWPENEAARTGLRDTRLKYARLAQVKGDYDLGLQIVHQESDGEFQELKHKLQQARLRRNGLKTITIVATLAVFCVGIISFIQRQQIVALVGTKESLEGQVTKAEEALVQAGVATQRAEEATAAAEERRDEAEQLAQNAQGRIDAKQAELDAKEEEVRDKVRELAGKVAELAGKDRELNQVIAALETEEMKVAAAAADLEVARQNVKDEQQKVKDAQQKVKDEQQRVAAAKAEVTRSKRELAELGQQKQELNKEKLRAGVDLQNAKIASSIRNADYPAALRIVEDLLAAFETDEELRELPADERADRVRELKARQRQLERRATRNLVPVQSQIYSPSANMLVQADADGQLTARTMPTGAPRLPSQLIASTQTPDKVSSLQISADQSLVVAASGRHLLFWSPQAGDVQRVENGAGAVTTVRLQDGILLSADVNGQIIGWDVSSRQPLWSIRSTSSIRDIEVMPSARMFVYAGSRGGQSADILAYRLPPADDPTARPQRLGQLRLPRNRNFPPQCITVAPDESALLIGNSRNGELICLQRRTPAEDDRDQFPFEHAADLDQTRTDSWLTTRHQRPINEISFAGNGVRMVTASDDRSVCVWELTDGRPQFVERLEGHGARVNSAVFTDQSGRYVLSASADRSCRTWDVQQYDQEQQQLEQDFELDIFDSARRPGGPKNVGQKPGREISAWTPLATGYLLTRAPMERAAANSTAASLAGVHAAADLLKDYVVLNADSQQQRGAINSMCLSDDGNRLVTGADDGSAVIWDTRTGRPVKGVSTRRDADPAETAAFEEGHEFNVARLRFLPPDGHILLTTGFDGTLCLWDADTRKRHAGRQEMKLPGLGLVNAIAASTDGRLVATSSSGGQSGSGTAIIWHTSSLLSADGPLAVAKLTGFHRAEVSAIAFSPDAALVVTGGRDGRVGVWRTDSGRLVAVGQIHARNTIVSHLQWMADDRVLSVGFDGRMTLIDASDTALAAQPSGKPARLTESLTFVHDRVPVERVATHPQGRRFTTISVRTDKATQKVAYELQLWDAQSPQPRGRIHLAKVGGAAPQRIVAVNWSADGERLAVVADSHLQILDTRTWKVVSVLNSPGLGISDAVFAPAGTNRKDREHIIATFDGTSAHLWNIRTREHVVDFRPLFAVQSTAYLQDKASTLLVTGDRAIRVFQADERRRDFGQTLLKIGDPHAGIITHIQFAKSDEGPLRFVTTGADGTVALWHWAEDGATFVRWLREDNTPVVSAAWLDDDRVLITERSGLLRLVSSSNRFEPVITTIDDDRTLQLSRGRMAFDGRHLAVAGQDADSGESLAWIFQLTDNTLTLHATIQGGHEAGGITDICFLPDSPYLMTGGADGGALIWNWLPRRNSSTPLAAYEAYQFLSDENSLAHNAPITCIEVAADGTIATASQDGTAIIWTNPFRRDSQQAFEEAAGKSQSGE